MDESRRLRVLQKLTANRSESPKQKTSISMKIQATETKSLIEKLQSEIIQICSAKRSMQSKELVRVLDKYTEQTIPLGFISHTASMVRRLASLLIALVFEHKSDLFRFRLLNNQKNVCLCRNQLFLTKISPAIRNSRPEPLYHVKKALMYYLPASTFPRGLTCYLDDAKLTNIFIEGELLRLPDPAEHVIWMDFDELAAEPPLAEGMLLNESENSSSSHSDSSSSSGGLRDPNKDRRARKKPRQQKIHKIRIFKDDSSVQSSSVENNPAQLHRLDSMDEQGKLNTLFDAITQIKKQAKDEIADEVEPKEPPKESVHRIKCFQFFRKPKKDVPASSSRSLHSSMSVQSADLKPTPGKPPRVPDEQENDMATSGSICGDGLSDQIPTPPQFESVNDWATDKDYTHFSCQMRYVPVKPITRKTRHDTSDSGTISSDPFYVNPEKRKYNLNIQNMVTDLLKLENEKELNNPESTTETKKSLSKPAKPEKRQTLDPNRGIPENLDHQKSITVRKSSQQPESKVQKDPEQTTDRQFLLKSTKNLVARPVSPYRIVTGPKSAQKLSRVRLLPNNQPTAATPPKSQPTVGIGPGVSGSGQRRTQQFFLPISKDNLSVSEKSIKNRRVSVKVMQDDSSTSRTLTTTRKSRVNTPKGSIKPSGELVDTTNRGKWSTSLPRGGRQETKPSQTKQLTGPMKPVSVTVMKLRG